ncbi:DDE-type integrase/transposase/recombinase [Lysinibacillus sphaericus]|nr:DDE-type integrase/transposase/recombinase [Lysinibacillus sphaericus]
MWPKNDSGSGFRSIRLSNSSAKSSARTHLHTDLGSQYTSAEALKQLKKYEMIPSFSRKGCPYYNACIESFHATPKKEKVYK